MKVKDLFKKMEELESKIEGWENVIKNFSLDHVEMKKVTERLNRLHPTPAQDPYDPAMYAGLHKEPHEDAKIKAMLREEMESIANAAIEKRFEKIKKNLEKQLKK